MVSAATIAVVTDA